MRKKILCVSFPVDLGNESMEQLYVRFFEGFLDVKTYRFAPRLRNSSDSDYYRTVIRRAWKALALGWVLIKARWEGRSLVFLSLSPALFGAWAYPRRASYAITDSPFIDGRSRPIKKLLHRWIIRRQKKCFCQTDRTRELLVKGYGLRDTDVTKLRLPLGSDLDYFSGSPERNDGRVRLLFVGGDFRRKGGPELLRWFESSKSAQVELTLVTKHSVQSQDSRVKVYNEVVRGTPLHRQLFEGHDIFVLPTHFDTYGIVLGEAASAGLCVLSTEAALGAPEVIEEGRNGFIAPTHAIFFARLDALLSDRALMARMKSESRKVMHERFEPTMLSREYSSHF
jgi:glycosyltransferase involved in cell wall biosynthesis